MEVWALDIHFNTDGDFGWRLAPIAMTYNANDQFYRLSVVREVKSDVEKRQVTAEFTWILKQLIANLHTDKNYVFDYVDEMLNDSLDEEWKKIFVMNCLVTMMVPMFNSEFIRQKIKCLSRLTAQEKSTKKFKRSMETALESMEGRL